MSEPTIEGMVDDLGRPATIFTPPEVLRRDPARWPTPAEFVSEWEKHTPAARLALAEQVIADGQARAEVERLRQWKAEAIEVILGLQDLGRALELPLGTRITGTEAAEAVTELRAELERTKRGARELGRVLDRSLRDALEASGRHDVIAEDGDGDWAVVWETLAALRPRAEAAEAREVALRGRIEAERRYFAGSPSWLSATQSAAVALRFSAALAAEPIPPAAPHAEDGALTLETAPPGTRAPSYNGGAWVRVERGWKWNADKSNAGGTFPRPGGDWTGKLVRPAPVADPSGTGETR